MARPGQEIRSLTGLRSLAALAVAGAHMPWLTGDPSLGTKAKHFLTEGFVGVPFFFVLSGFVLAFTYAERFPTLSRVGLWNYYCARVARVYPVHWLTLAAAVALGAAVAVPVLLANALLLHAWVPDLEYVQSFNSVSWTLSIEVFFYLVLPFIVWAAGRLKLPAWSLVPLAGVGWFLQFALVKWHAAGLTDWSLWVCNVCPVVRLGEFAAGAFLGLNYAKSGDSPPPRWRGRLLWTVAEGLAVLYLFWLVKNAAGVLLLLRMCGYYVPAMAVLIAVFARERGYLSWLMGTRVPVYLGAISYAFYMVHGLVLETCQQHIGSERLGPYGLSAAGIVLAGLTAAAVHHFVEVPARRGILKWTTIRSSKTTA